MGGSSEEGGGRQKKGSKMEPIKQMWKLLWPKLSGTAEERTGWKHIALLFGLSVFRVWVGANTLYIHRDLITAIHLRDAKVFWPLVARNLVFGLGHSIHRQCLQCTTELLAATWRRKLTRLLHAQYFSGINYYKLASIEQCDPDERIAEDVKKVTEVMGRVIHNSCSAITTCAYFLPLLVRESGWFFAFAPFGYLSFGFWASANLGGITPPEIGKLMGALGGQFGVYRTSVMRTKIHGEAIAALKGSPLEREIICKNFDGMMGKQWNYWRRVIRYEWLRDVTMWPTGVRLFSSVLATAPILFSRRSAMFKTNSAEATANAMSKVMFDMDLQYQAFFGVITFLMVFRNQQYVSGSAARILDMMKLLEACEQAAAKEEETTFVSDNTGIEFTDVNISTPSGNKLVNNLNFRIEKNSSMLLTGHNGAGKSSIFRCLGGLWPVAAPGVIKRPGSEAMGKGLNADVYYLPQKPYDQTTNYRHSSIVLSLCKCSNDEAMIRVWYNVIGTLAQQLTYPDSDAGKTLHLDTIREILAQVQIEHIAERENVLTEDTNWHEVLSLGEQQRLAIARLIFHKPAFAILDECTSAVPDAMVELLYRVCRENGITYITISHRPALKRHHDFILTIGEATESKWSFHDLRSENALAASASLQVGQETPQRVGTTSADDEAAKVASDSRSIYRENRSKKYRAAQAVQDAETKRIENKQSKDTDSTKIQKFLAVMRIALPYGSGGLRLIVMLFGSVLAQTALMSTFVRGMGEMKGALVLLDKRRYVMVSSIFFVNGLMLAAAGQVTKWLSNCLNAKLRTNLTKYLLQQFLDGNTFYTLINLDKTVTDPEERITTDVRDFAENVSELFSSVAKPLFDAVYFSATLSVLLGPRGMATVYGYLVFGLYLVKLFMPNYTEIIRKAKSIEGKFKFVHARVRTHAESIAFFGGGEAERIVVNHHFDNLTKVNENKCLRQYLQCGIPTQFFTAAHGHSVPDNLQYTMQYLHMSQAHTGSGHAQLAANDHFVSQSVRTIIEAFSVIIEFSEKFAQLSGVTSRIWQLLDVLVKLHAVQRSKTESTSAAGATGSDGCTPTIRFDRVDIVTPSGDCLAEALSLDIDASSPLMITGLNGCGKSSVARVLSGVWPAHGGSLSVPSEMKLHLVPQKVYSCQGSMADQLTYPIRIPKEERTAEVEARMQACLEMVSLGYLSTREDAGWDAVLKWEDVLSLGEQQRMGMARMFYDSPPFAVLDEATSAVSMDVEVQLYQAAAEQQMTLITISQRLALTQFHAQELRLGMDTPEGWALHQIAI